MIRILVLLLLVWSVGCSHVLKPSKVYEKRDLNFSVLVDGASKPIQITPETVVVDARSAFEYTMAHVPGSVNLHWNEFVKDKRKAPGELKADLDRVARRLALLGISLDTPVVIVGQGPAGGGEEGRLAWMLIYLGLKDVQIVSLNSLKAPISNAANEPPRKNAEFWKPLIVSEVLADRDEVIRVVSGQAPLKTHIIDVRSEGEFLKKRGLTSLRGLPRVNAVNIEWKEFLSSSGRPKVSLRKRLEAIGVNRGDRVLVVSDRGLRSATATAALLSMGYSRAANVAGGYSKILNKPANRFR